MVNGLSCRKIATQNLYAGENILRAFKSEYPYLNSNTRYSKLIEKHTGNDSYSEIIPYLRGQACLSGFKISQIRNSYNNRIDKVDKLKKLVKSDKAGNCKECAYIIHDELTKRGIPAENIRLNILDKNGTDKRKNHTFTVFGLSEDAKLSKPESWGKNAIIIDGWTNMVKKAQEGIEYLKTHFEFNPENEVCTFEKYSNGHIYLN